MTARNGDARIRAVIATARQLADSAGPLLDAADGPEPGGPVADDSVAALLGVLLALADLTMREHPGVVR